MPTAPSSDHVLTRLMALHPKKIDLSLGRMERLLEKLGHPERKLPPVFHIAGTNGKGSTAAYLRAILEASGRKVHVYTSPHLVRFAERIRLAGRIIDEAALTKILEECESVNGAHPITFFEVTTAAAFLAFSRAPADAVILEVGLGGRLDATNLVDHPLVTAITPVSMDHESFLGDSIALIAAEKAGIAKPETPLVLGPQVDVALKVIAEKAALAHAPLICFGADWQVGHEADGFSFEDRQGKIHLPRPNLNGPHQILNAGLSIACLRAQKLFAVSDAQMAHGITHANWPARLQKITAASGLEGFPNGTEIWLDGGHNPAAGEILGETFKSRSRPLYLISGMLANKDTAGFLKPFANLASGLYAIDIEGEDCHPAEEVVKFAKAAGIKAEAAKGFPEALETLKARLKNNPCNTLPADILICGSLYLAGQVLRQFGLFPQ
jgi:dihydrofolate synthase/folylpolyglutamate synthase